jgi:hypothetical protein
MVVRIINREEINQIDSYVNCKSSRNSTKIKHVKIILKRLKSSNNRSQARKQRDPINRAKHKHRHTSLSKRWKKWHHHKKKEKKLLQGFEFSLQERSSALASEQNEALL